MKKDEFIRRRTKIISEMLDNPNEHGIYPTTKAFAALDDLFDKLKWTRQKPSWAQHKEEFDNHECILCKRDPDASWCIPKPKDVASQTKDQS